MARAFLDSMGFNKSEIEQMVEGKLKEQVIPGFLSVTPRMVMQTIGLEWGREAIDLDVWVNTAKRKIETLMSQGYSVIIDDMRFLNEFLMVKEIGGTTVRLTRASAPKLAGNHASEGALDNEEFDHYISNDGDLEELYFKARMLAQGLGSTKKVYA